MSRNRTGWRWPGRAAALRRICVGIAVLVPLAVAGCIPDPVVPEPLSPDLAIASGALVINEGIWRQDNATLTAYDPAGGTAVQDYFPLKNPGRRLGDIANSIAVHGNLAYIAVSTSLNIEVLHPVSGVSAGRIHLRAGNEPRQIAFADSRHGYVTTLLDSIFEFDPVSLALLRGFPAGPAPEGVAVAHGRLFVANSGFGYYRQEEPKAGTLGVYDLASGKEEHLLPAGPNPRTLRYLPLNDRLYVLYGLALSGGGLLEFDPVSLQPLRRWAIMDPRAMTLDERAGIAYVVGPEGVTRINLLADAPAPETLVPAGQWPGTIFHSAGVAPDGALYIGAVRSYTTPGEVLIFNRDGSLRARFPAGLNPKDYAFF